MKYVALFAGGLLASVCCGTAAGDSWAGLNGDSGMLLDVQRIEQPMMWFDKRPSFPVYDGSIQGKRANAVPGVTSLGRPPMSEPMMVSLSREKYPAEDGHLDVIVRLDLPHDAQPEGNLQVRIEDYAGQLLDQQSMDVIPGPQLFLAVRWPDSLIGQQGRIVIRWNRPGHQPVEVARSFAVADRQDIAQEGRVRLYIPNDSGAESPAIPVTVGVAFPRGALYDTSSLRLLDEQGQEILLQAQPTARWSRFGSIKWVLCDFVVSLSGTSRSLELAFDPPGAVSGRVSKPVDVQVQPGQLPQIDAGWLRVDASGIHVDPVGSGHFHTVLAAESLAGAFVEHVRGTNFAGWGHRWQVSGGKQFVMGEDVTFELEQSGPVKVVLKASGWFTHPGTGERFCQFVNRYVIHRDSPVMRVFHTWIFTGDGNRDVIRNMGWRFSLPETMKPVGFLPDLSDQADWQAGYYLRQHDHDAYDLFAYQAPRGNPPVADAVPARPLELIGQGKRCSGVMAAQGDGVRVYAGVQDFWQNFPSSLMLEDDAMTFYQWPRYGREASHSMTSEQMGDIWRLWFAHEGETLNFRLPRTMLEGSIYVNESGVEPKLSFGDAESANAQGIAKTAEMWLYITDGSESPGEAAKVLRGLRDETLRAVVDPVWMAGSGAFYDMAAWDPSAYESWEKAWLENVRSPLRIVDRVGIYGKWIYGDLLRGPDLDDQAGGLYRTFRKGHWGWPYSWLAYVRTGDTQLLQFAQAATRMMSDVSFCHYVSDQMREHFASLPRRFMWDFKQPFREIGWHDHNVVPWAGYYGPKSRGYSDEVEGLWHAWYLTGYGRARDVALAWGEQTKIEAPFTIDQEKMGRGPLTAGWNRGRWPIQIQKQYMEMYQATWDPWFLAGAQAIARMHEWRQAEEDYDGHIWNTGPREYHHYTQDSQHESFYLKFLESQNDWQLQGWANIPSNMLAALADGYHLTGNKLALRRLAGILDLSRWAIYSADDADHYRGYWAVGDGNTHMLFTSWMQKWFPSAIGAFQRAGYVPEHPLPLAFNQMFEPGMRIAFIKPEGQSLLVRTNGKFRLLDAADQVIQQADTDEVVLPAELPGGVYWIEPGRRLVRLPVTPPGTPEVVVLSEPNRIPFGQEYAQYWFQVPADSPSFTIRLTNTPPTTAYYAQDVRQIIVWDGDGREVWAHRQLTRDYDAQQSVIEACVEVSPAQAGRLWRITLPGRRSMPVQWDQQIPGILAHDPSRWFVP